MFSIRRLLKAESGYSLIEVLASIMIFTIAILPMVGVFDSGLRGTMASSNYDKARALANLKMEEAKSLPFDSGDPNIRDVEHAFPLAAGAAGTPTAYDDGPGLYQSGWTSVSATEPPEVAAVFPNDFEYSVEKQYMRQPDSSSANFEECDPASSDPNIACSPGTKLIRLTITVSWGSGTTYTTYGLVTE